VRSRAANKTCGQVRAPPSPFSSLTSSSLGGYLSFPPLRRVELLASLIWALRMALRQSKTTLYDSLSERTIFPPYPFVVFFFSPPQVSPFYLGILMHLLFLCRLAVPIPGLSSCASLCLVPVPHVFLPFFLKPPDLLFLWTSHIFPSLYRDPLRSSQVNFSFHIFSELSFFMVP